jgi:DNA-binding transcriptional LysR family regulator
MRHNLQRGSELAEHFGVPHGGHCPQMLVSVLYDVFGRFPVAATIAPAATSERQEVLKALREAGIEVVIRVPKSGSFDAIQVFRDSGGDDYRVLVHPSPAAARAGVDSLDLRCVRLDVGGDDPWLLLTTLRRSEFTLSQLKQIDHLR